MPPHIVHTGTSSSSPAEVWGALAAFDRIGAWAGGVDHSSSLTASTEGVGAGRRVQVGRTTLIETVAAWVPERELAYTIDGLPPLARSVVNRWRLEPASDGTTVTLTVEVDPGPTPRGRLAARALGLAMRRPTRRLLDDLLAHVAPMAVPGAEAAA
ncbi:MAG TPA: SRPBCC family protein [Aquihabitans sp.]|jgi:hypothetical protein|nr:SRPBCC family protein [Aquihabitans sp.]